MTTPEAVITSYLDNIQDEAYLEAALARYGAAALVDAAVRLVRSLETERFNDAALFIRDVSTGIFQQEVTHAFRALLPGSGLFDALDQCLRAPVFHLRSQAAYTLGKLSYPDNADRLIRALQDRRDTDPLLTPQLVFDIRWLRWEDEAHWQRIQWLAEAPEGVCRWAALQAIEDTTPCPPGSPIDALLATLQQDRFDYIRTEATYLRKRLNRETRTPQPPTAAEHPQVPAPGNEQAEQATANHTPMAFSDLSIRFWQHHTAADYTPADLRAFLAQQAPSQDMNTP